MPSLDENFSNDRFWRAIYIEMLRCVLEDILAMISPLRHLKRFARHAAAAPKK